MAAGAGNGGGAPSFRQPLYRCPVCPAVWPSCHELRNHLYTIHPNEAAELVIPLVQYVENSRRGGRVPPLRQAPTPPPPPAPLPPRSPVPVLTVQRSFVPLPPNPAFWEEYRGGGSPPVEIGFFFVVPPPAIAAPPAPEPAVTCGLQAASESDSESSELDILV
ncbi:proline-rich transmembrane protein 1-like [Oryza brachyantha]|uniref:proline-rich transmembrane protein 1-like n=1 Tax=Oryza brachyantha TaxID=4533 RepID=UPI001ADB57F4|nr:proline-rich transmembrane protein 1-like [Oryza brachyantha]